MDTLKHYGMPRRSGRYPWGSGEEPYQRGAAFMKEYSDLRKKGLSDVEIAEGWGMKTGELRSRKTIARSEMRANLYAEAIRLKDKGYSDSEIGRKMGKNESSIRALLDPVLQERSQRVNSLANVLKLNVDEKKFIDVGLGIENHLGESRTMLKASIEKLKQEGYTVHFIKVPQAGTVHNTHMMVLAPPGTDWREVEANKANVQLPMNHDVLETGRSHYGLDPIKNISSKEVFIRYKEDGGADKDGVIELRRGVSELDLGQANYAQVRIGVDGTHYLKGMAMYADDVPKGFNVIYNTNKNKGTPSEKVFKAMTEDPDNPFGAQIKEGGQRGALNIVYEEGDWMKWSKSLSSQILSKQNPPLVKQQLDLAFKTKNEEFESIMALTNPVIKKKLLSSFADDADSAAVHLKAAALPRQGWHTLLPFPKMNPQEIYAPNYNDGEQVVLIRYPHGGTFEIPTLTVNNRQPMISKIIGRARDAVGIHPKVAERLSGADFDGDSVLVIPTNGKTIKTTSPLKGLQNFNPKESYPPYDGMKTMDGGFWDEKKGVVDFKGKRPSSRTKGLKMGDISNLITDMTIMAASTDEIARAVRHSMVVIDAEKHHLNYKQSFTDNGIAALKKKYQGREDAGAATIISRASSQKAVPHRSEYFDVDPLTGKKIYKYTGETSIKITTNKKGEKIVKTVPKITMSTKMMEVDDARQLSSGTIVEGIYATHANKLKALANQARKVAYHTKSVRVNESARKTYAPEVQSLMAKLNIALKNAPLERQAQLLADKVVRMKIADNPHLKNDYATLKKIKGQAIAEARVRNGSKKNRVDIFPREWEAIQAGAFTNNTLNKIIDNSDLDKVKALATPKPTNTLSPAKAARAKSMKKSGYTSAEIAKQIGVSVTTINKVTG
jgi:hypothetical protein